MGGTVWNSWALWVKLCFVLGCAIVVTIILGCIKLLYNRYRLRKYTAIANNKQASLAEREQSSEVVQRRANNVPFGIRAIESGIAVDGVWISRPNTPVPSTPASFATSSVDEHSHLRGAGPSDRMSSSSNLSRLEIPQPLHLDPGASPGRPSIISQPQSSVPSRVFAGQVPGRPKSPNTEPGPGTRETYKPRHSSHLRYSNPNLLRHSTTLDALEGHRHNVSVSAGASEGSAEDQKTTRSSNSSDQSGSSQEHYVPRRPTQIRFSSSMANPLDPVHLTPIESLPFAEGGRGDLNSLASHRLSHAAETGQLLPRVRRSEASGDWTSSRQPTNQHSEIGDYFNSYRPTPANNDRNPFATSRGSLVSDGIALETTPFRDFVDSNPATIEQPEAPLHGDEKPAPHPYCDVLRSADANQQISRTVNVRKVNPGFEILPAGTFNVQRQSTKQPIGRQAVGREDKRHSRKLQKKRPDAMHSRESSIPEQD